MKSIKLLIVYVFAVIAAMTGCKYNKTLSLGEAKAMIETNPVTFHNAESGTTDVGGMYYTLTTVFGTSDGRGICLTLSTRHKFEAKEYKVQYVERPDIDNAQMTFIAADHNIYEAVSNKGSGSVIIHEITDHHIKGTFSGKFVLQDATSPVIEIKGGEFDAHYIPTPTEFQ